MLPLEHSAILLTFIQLPFVMKVFVLSIFEWPLKTCFTVYSHITRNFTNLSHPTLHLFHSIQSIQSYEEEGHVCYERDGP